METTPGKAARLRRFDLRVNGMWGMAAQRRQKLKVNGAMTVVAVSQQGNRQTYP
jgi:hypothetical protein